MRNTAGAKRPTKPRCEECDSVHCHPYRIGETADGLGTSYGYEWLCGACKYKRDYPDAPPEPELPRERKVPLQKETLFDVEAMQAREGTET